MGLIAAVAGPYKGTYNATNIGICSDDGFKLRHTFAQDMVENSDQYGRTIIEGFYLGGNSYLDFTMLEWTAPMGTLFDPYSGNDPGLLFSAAKPISRAMTGLALPVVLTATAGTPAATKPASVTGAQAILAPNFSREILFNPKHRVMPISLLLLPYDAGGGSIRTFLLT